MLARLGAAPVALTAITGAPPILMSARRSPPMLLAFGKHHREHRRACDRGIHHVAAGLDDGDRRLGRLARSCRRGRPRAMRLLEAAVPFPSHLFLQILRMVRPSTRSQRSLAQDEDSSL